LTAVSSRAIACPFCGLVCDDLVLDAGAIDARGCAKASIGFGRRATLLEPRIAGRAASLEAAVDAAAALLAAARRPLFTGLSVDLAGARALLALADRTGAVVDRWRSAAQHGNLAVMERAGAFTATFGEIANRADVVLLLGQDPTQDYPRLFERLLHNPAPLYRPALPWVAYLGPESVGPVDGLIAERIDSEPSALLDALSTLAALIGGRRTESPPMASLTMLAERLKEARYGAILWDTAAFPSGEGELAAALLLRMLRELNRTTRCVGLPLGGNDNAQGIAQAMLWQAGWPTRLSFAGGEPVHDPWACDAERLVDDGEIDALLWVAAISPTPPPSTSVPVVALLAGDIVPPMAPAVEIRIGIPGIDHTGTIVRADTVIAMPLAAARPSTLPSVETVALLILERLGSAA
jgi:formylmethanofuran dehydrogenase subunit B